MSNNTANNENAVSQYSPLMQKKIVTKGERKDSEDTLKTANVTDQRKFSNMASNYKQQQRSKSFTKPPKRRRKKDCKRKGKKDEESEETKSK